MGCGASTPSGPPWTQEAFDRVSFVQGKPCKYYAVDWSRPLGSGSYGTVWKATETAVPDGQGRVVALKIMDKLDPNVSDCLEGIAQEVQVHRQMVHPNIVRLLHSHETAGTIVLAQEIISVRLSRPGTAPCTHPFAKILTPHLTARASAPHPRLYAKIFSQKWCPALMHLADA